MRDNRSFKKVGKNSTPPRLTSGTDLLWRQGWANDVELSQVLELVESSVCVIARLMIGKV